MSLPIHRRRISLYLDFYPSWQRYNFHFWNLALYLLNLFWRILWVVHKHMEMQVIFICWSSTLQSTGLLLFLLWFCSFICFGCFCNPLRIFCIYDYVYFFPSSMSASYFFLLLNFLTRNILVLFQISGGKHSIFHH